MDSQLPDIPELTSGGRDGDDRERKGAGAPWLGGGAAPGAGGIGAGGAVVGAKAAGGAGAVLASLAAKPLVLATLMGLLVAGAGVGLHRMMNDAGGGKAAKKKALFPKGSLSAPAKYEPSAGGDRSSSLQYVAQPNAGALNEGAPAASVAPPVQPEGSADADAAAKDAAGGAAGAGIPSDPNAMMSQLAGGDPGQGQGGVGGRFGKLSSSLGQGLSGLRGGGGLSGGIGRGFDSPKGGPPYGGGAGNLQAFARPATPTRSKVPIRNVVKSGHKNANLKRLDNMNRAMAPTKNSGNVQQAAATQTDQWSSGAPASGQSLTGAGAADVPGGSAGSSGGSLETPNPDTGGPIGANPTPDTPETDMPEIPEGGNVTPWQGMVDSAYTMLILAAIIIGIMTILKHLFKVPFAAGIALTIWKIMWGLVIAIGAIVTGIGAYLMGAMGQTALGGIYTAAGALTMTAGILTLAMEGVAWYWPLLLGAVVPLAGGIWAGDISKDKAEDWCTEQQLPKDCAEK